MEREIELAREEGGVEFVQGRLIDKPCSRTTSSTSVQIIMALGPGEHEAEAPWVFTSNLGYQCFADDPTGFRKPSVSVIKAARMKGVDQDAPLCTIPPDLAVEVVDSAELIYDHNRRIDQYLANGFPLIWVVEPRTRTVTVYRGDGSVSRLHETDEIDGESALPTFKCKVSEFFGKPG